MNSVILAQQTSWNTIFFHVFLSFAEWSIISFLACRLTTKLLAAPRKKATVTATQATAGYRNNGVRQDDFQRGVVAK